MLVVLVGVVPVNILPIPAKPTVAPNILAAVGSNAPVASDNPSNKEPAAGNTDAANPSPVAFKANFPSLEKSFF